MRLHKTRFLLVILALVMVGWGCTSDTSSDGAAGDIAALRSNKMDDDADGNVDEADEGHDDDADGKVDEAGESGDDEAGENEGDHEHGDEAGDDGEHEHGDK